MPPPESSRGILTSPSDQPASAPTQQKAGSGRSAFKVPVPASEDEGLTCIWLPLFASVVTYNQTALCLVIAYWARRWGGFKGADSVLMIDSGCAEAADEESECTPAAVEGRVDRLGGFALGGRALAGR